VPAAVKVGSNGTLAAIAPITGNTVRYEWKERYPIDYYLISVAVSKYTEYSWYMHFTGSNDSMLIMNYVPAPLLPAVRPMLDTTALLVDHFSTLFGRYPFWKEKYGHSYTPSFVHMEHQTMTSTRMSRLTIIAHELAHQWFGDNVTCGTWKDIWLNEGFAAYGQYLTYEHFNGIDTARSFIRTAQASATSEDWGSVYAYDTADRQRIFDGRLTYNKGACVVHMLRCIAGDDQLFYKILQTYQQQYAGRTATTEDLQHVAETVLGRKLDTFFLQWIYGAGFPYYTATWNQVNDLVYVRIDQRSSATTAVGAFAMPMELKLYSQQGDTIVNLYTNQASQIGQWTTGRTIDSIAIDPKSWLLYKATARPVKDASLNLLPSSPVVYPNPVNNTLYIAYKDLNDPHLLIYDAAGRKVADHKLQWPSGIDTMNMQYLPAGVYVYRIVSGGKAVAEGQLVKGGN